MALYVQRVEYGATLQKGMFSTCEKASGKRISETFTAQKEVQLCFSNYSSHPFNKCVVRVTIGLVQS